VLPLTSTGVPMNVTARPLRVRVNSGAESVIVDASTA